MLTNTLLTRTGTVKATSHAGTDRPSRRYEGDRTCEAPGCSTRLSTYNPRRRCWIHEQPRPTYLRIRPRPDEGPAFTSLEDLSARLTNGDAA